MQVLPSHPMRIVIVGRSDSGKTTLFIKLLSRWYKNKKFDKIYVLSPSYYTDPRWTYVKVPPCRVATGNYDRALQKINDRIVKGDRKESTLILCDDCGGVNSFSGKGESNVIKTMVYNARWMNLSIIFSIQSLKDCPISLRESAEALFIVSPPTRHEARFLDEYYGWSNFREYRDFLLKHTNGQYEFLLIRNYKGTIHHFDTHFQLIRR